MNPRIERRTPREDFLVNMFQDDPRLVEALKRDKEESHSTLKGILIGTVFGIVLWIIIYGVARAIDKGF